MTGLDIPGHTLAFKLLCIYSYSPAKTTQKSTKNMQIQRERIPAKNKLQLSQQITKCWYLNASKQGF